MDFQPTNRNQLENGNRFKDLPYAWLMIRTDWVCILNYCFLWEFHTISRPTEKTGVYGLNEKKAILEQKAEEIYQFLTTFNL